MNGARLDRSDAIVLTVGEQVIELPAVGLEALAFIENLAEHALHRRHVLPDRRPAAKLLAHVRRGAQVVGMDMGIDDPVALELLLAHECDQAIGRFRFRAAGGLVEIEQ